MHKAKQDDEAASEGGISVIIPMFNVELFIGQCLASILPQLNKNDEVICIDDGSTDRTAEIVGKLQSHHSNVRLLRQANLCAAEARNSGLRIAKGEYVMFVDGDDCLHHEALDHVREAMRGGCDIHCFSMEQFNDGGRRVKELAPIREGEYASGRDAYLMNTLPSFVTTKAFRRDFLQAHGLMFDYDIAEDEIFLLHAYILAGKTTMSNRKIYRYRIHPASISHRSDSSHRMANVYIKAASKFSDFAKKHPDKAYWQKVTFNCIVCLYLYIYRATSACGVITFAEGRLMLRKHAEAVAHGRHAWRGNGLRAWLIALAVGYPHLCYRLFGLVAKIKGA